MLVFSLTVVGTMFREETATITLLTLPKDLHSISVEEEEEDVQHTEAGPD